MLNVSIGKKEALKNKIDHIYWFAPFGLMCPSTRYRGFLPLNYLKRIGVNYDFIYPDKSLKPIFSFIFLYLKILLFRKPNSIIVIQKVHSNRIYANALKLLIRVRNKKTVYDLDDAEQYRRNTKTIEYFLKNCQNISVGSSFLKKYCQQFNDNVFLQTSPVSRSVQNIEAKKNKKLHIGWVGDLGNGNRVSKVFSHKTSLFKLLFPNLRKIKYPIKLSLIGVKNPDDIPEIKNYFKGYSNVELDIPVNLNWNNDIWVYNKIGTFDLGISLMVDHPFNQGKSAFKAKQYLVCGVPVLANNVGETSKFVIDKVNGFICNNDVEIIKAINIVHNMSDHEYKAISKRCIKNISGFSIDRYCSILLDNVK